jgi:hypothetical protein
VHHTPGREAFDDINLGHGCSNGDDGHLISARAAFLGIGIITPERRCVEVSGLDFRLNALQKNDGIIVGI